jgi:hypothetical protein
MVADAAKRIGSQLRRAMAGTGIDARELAALTGKRAEHLKAVLDGYPNSDHTPLDTVDEIAAVLGKRLDLTARR